MEQLNRQVRKARRRLVFQQFCNRFAWCLFAGLILSALAIGVSKFYPVGVESNLWALCWLGGALGVALMGAMLWTGIVRHSSLDAALELDRRFDLKERVSSTLSLGQLDRETEVGRALIADTVRRVERIDVAAQFRLTTGRRTWLPLLPAIIAVGLLFLPDAVGEQQAAAANQQAQTRKQLKNSTKALRKKIAKRREQAEKKNLKDAAELFKKIETGLKRANQSKRSDRKKAIVELNNLANELKQRRSKLQGAKQLRRQFGKMKDFGKGPAEKIASALKKGDVKAAMDEIKKLQDKLAANDLTPDEQKKLAEQFSKMAEQLANAAQAHQAAREKLEKEIDQLRAAGDLAAAEQKQQQLDQLNRQNQNMKQMNQLAKKLAKCAQCAGDGKSGEASDQLAGLSDQLSEMQEQLEEMEMLDEALEQFAEAKNSMKCKECSGAGCSACQGGGKGNGKSRSIAQGKGKGKGNGLGKGRGRGDRPIDEDQFGTFDTNAPRNLRKGGKSVVIGSAGGANIKGPVREELKTAFESGDTKDADALNSRRLPRSQQEQARQYFDLLRDE